MDNTLVTKTMPLGFNNYAQKTQWPILLELLYSDVIQKPK
jgi:hypothetical protein